MTTIAAAEQTATPQDTTHAVIAAARDHVARMIHTPNWQERLTPEARRLAVAVLNHNAAESAVTCVTCGAEWPNHYPTCPQIRPVRNEHAAAVTP